MIETENFQQIEIACATDLHDWLQANHQLDESFWLVTFKKEVVPEKYVSREDILNELIAFDWIAGIKRKLDDKRAMQLISKRRQQKWAKSYRDRADKLKAEGKMQRPGLAAIKIAISAGTYVIHEDVDALETPPDLERSLKASNTAFQYFMDCPPSYKRNLLRWLKAAKKVETRQNRITKIVSACDQEKRIPNY